MGDVGASGEASPDGKWEVTDWILFQRFLSFAEESGCCKVESEKEASKGDSQKRITAMKENIAALKRLIENGRGVAAVHEIVRFSEERRTAKPKALIFALAICAHLDDKSENLQTKQAAFHSLPKVCRFPPDLFTYVKYSELVKDKSKGWGNGQRKAISRWYNSKEPMQLAMFVTKYITRNGWSHCDVLRLSHAKPKNDLIAAVFMYVTKGLTKTNEKYNNENATEEMKQLLSYFSAVIEAKTSTDVVQVAGLISEYKLVREQIATWFNAKPEIWRALLPHMPLLSLMRNLGKLTALNLLRPLTPDSLQSAVVERLKDFETLKAVKIHPFTILVALKNYESGKGGKGKKKWRPSGIVIDALYEAFYASFQNIEPTGKKYLLALDVSKSMRYGDVQGSASITPALATASLAMATARSEASCQLFGFSTDMVEVPFTKDMKLQQVMKEISAIPCGPTDCCKPIQWAIDNKQKVDVFVIYTDCETWASDQKPLDVLKQYRVSLGVHDAKLIVCALSRKKVENADPSDGGMLDISGYDSTIPTTISHFVKGDP